MRFARAATSHQAQIEFLPRSTRHATAPAALCLGRRARHAEIERVEVLLRRERRLLNTSLERVGRASDDFQFRQSQQIFFVGLIGLARFPSQLLRIRHASSAAAAVSSSPSRAVGAQWTSQDTPWVKN